MAIPNLVNMNNVNQGLESSSHEGIMSITVDFKRSDKIVRAKLPWD